MSFAYAINTVNKAYDRFNIDVNNVNEKNLYYSLINCNVNGCNIRLEIPTYRTVNYKKKDYRFSLNNQILSHVDINLTIYGYLNHHANHNVSIALSDLFNDIYFNGLNIDIKKYEFLLPPIYIRGIRYDILQFTEIIYWLIAQEDINFPRPDKMGIRMPLSRYQESIIAAMNSQYLTIDDINIRTDTNRNKQFNLGEFKVYQCGDDLPRDLIFNNLFVPNQILVNVDALR